MTDVATAEYVMPEAEAARLTNRITLIAGTIREGMEKLQGLVAEAKAGNAHVALGYPSWTAYLADVLGKEPMRLDRAERQELVGYLAGEGMSTRAIAPIVGVDNKTVHNDLKRTAGPVEISTPARGPLPPFDGDAVMARAIESARQGEKLPPFDPRTGEILDGPPAVQITGMDGKTYSRPEPSGPRATPRRALVDTARDAGQELRKATERLERIAGDDRFARNKEEVAAHLRHHLNHAIEVCQDLSDRLNKGV